MNIKTKLSAIALGCGILASGSLASASVCQGSSTTWNQFVQHACSGRANLWGSWQGSDKKFHVYAFNVLSTDSAAIAAIDANGSVINGCITQDTTPGDGNHNYIYGGVCNAGVKYLYQVFY